MAKGIKEMGKREAGAKSVNRTVQVDRSVSLIITNQLRKSASRRPPVCVAIPALTVSVGSVTDTLNCNWDCAYVNDFPSQLKISAWVSRGQLLKRQQNLWGAGENHYFDRKDFWDSNREWSCLRLNVD